MWIVLAGLSWLVCVVGVKTSGRQIISDVECKPLALQFNFITIVEPRILIFTTGWDIFETTIGCVANDTLPYLLTSRSALYEKWPMLWNSNFFAANNRNVSGIHGQIFFNNTLEFLFYWSVSKHSIQNYVALVLTIQENRPRLDYNTFLLMRDTSTLIEIYNSDSVYVARVNHAGNVYLRLARIQKLLHQLYILNDDHSESVFISINRHQQTILLHHSTTLHSEQLEPFRERIQSGMLIHRKFFLFTTREVWIFEKPPNLHREAPIESIPFKLYSLFAFFECNSSVAVKHSDCEIPSNMNYNYIAWAEAALMTLMIAIAITVYFFFHHRKRRPERFYRQRVSNISDNSYSNN